MKTAYFNPAPTTAEELKKMYRALAMKHHPDRGGDGDTMKRINAEFEALYSVLKDRHTAASGETYTAKETTTETASEFINVINRLIHLDNIKIEIIGRFIWVSGDTKPCKDLLKSLGFRWHSKKLFWYLPPPNYRRKTRRDLSIDDIRNLFGSEEVETRPAAKVTAYA